MTIGDDGVASICMDKAHEGNPCKNCGLDTALPVDIRTEELLSCPFCGDKPEIEQDGEFEDVACLNVTCLVQPRALGVNTKAARETWNTRVLDN